MTFERDAVKGEPLIEVDLATLCADIRTGVVDLAKQSSSESLVCTGDQARELLTATLGNVTWNGTIHGDVIIDFELPGSLWITGRVFGDVKVVAGGKVNGNLAVVGGAVSGQVRVDRGGNVSGSLTVQDDGSVGSVALLRRSIVTRNLVVVRNSHVRGDIVIMGASRVGGDVVVAKTALVAGDFVLDTGAEIKGDLIIADGGSVAGEIFLAGDIESLDLSSPDPLKIIHISGRGSGPVSLGEGCSLESCDFRQFTRFEQLQLVGSSLFPYKKGRAHIAESQNGLPIPHVELSTLYRRFRLRLEKQGNRPSASDFYYRETEHRRAALKEQSSTGRRIERAILTGYRSISAYGTRAWPAAAWFVAIAVLGATSFAIGGVNLDPTYGVQEGKIGSGWGWSERGQLLMFTARSMVSFFRPPLGELSAVEDAIQLCLRFLGPALLAQFLLALRDRTAR